MGENIKNASRGKEKGDLPFVRSKRVRKADVHQRGKKRRGPENLLEPVEKKVWHAGIAAFSSRGRTARKQAGEEKGQIVIRRLHRKSSMRWFTRHSSTRKQGAKRDVGKGKGKNTRETPFLDVAHGGEKSHVVSRVERGRRRKRGTGGRERGKKKESGKESFVSSSL